jgi:cell division protein FtsA
MIKRKNIFAILDIGTTKVSIIIAKRNFNNECEILSISKTTSKGIRAGTVTSLEDAERSIFNAVKLAEDEAEVRVKNVFVSLNSSFLISGRNSQDIQVAEQEINIKDLNNILLQVLDKYDRKKVEIIHTIPYEYVLDGSRGIIHPEGLHGNKLTAFFHIVCAPINYLTNIEKCLAKCHLTVEGYIASGFASGLSSLRKDEIEFGSAIIEVGGGSSTISIFYNNNLIFTEGVPYGGVHVTNDIAKVLNLDTVVAEKIKILHGSVFDMRGIVDNIININDNNVREKSTINQSELNEIIKARLEEILKLLKNRVLEANVMDVVNGIVIVGDGSAIIGLNELVEQIFGKKSRIALPEGVKNIKQEFLNPSYATAVGMYKNIENIKRYDSRNLYNNRSGTTRKFWRWIKENF